MAIDPDERREMTPDPFRTPSDAIGRLRAVSADSTSPAVLRDLASKTDSYLAEWLAELVASFERHQSIAVGNTIRLVQREIAARAESLGPVGR